MQTTQVSLEDALRAHDFNGLRDAAEKLAPAEVASLFSTLTAEQQAPLFRVLPRELATRTFEYLPLKEQEELLKALGQEDVAAILNKMSDDDRTRLLEELPAAATRQMLALLDEKERVIALRLLGYPEDSVGRLMTPHYIALRPHWTVTKHLPMCARTGRTVKRSIWFMWWMRTAG